MLNALQFLPPTGYPDGVLNFCLWSSQNSSYCRDLVSEPIDRNSILLSHTCSPSNCFITKHFKNHLKKSDTQKNGKKTAEIDLCLHLWSNDFCHSCQDYSTKKKQSLQMMDQF